MLANRADIYNLGEIIGDTADVFEMSYIESCLTSNPVLGRLARRSQSDVYQIIKIAETDSREGIELEGNYSMEEGNEKTALEIAGDATLLGQAKVVFEELKFAAGSAQTKKSKLLFW